jgi:hypothetical protein
LFGISRGSKRKSLNWKSRNAMKDFLDDVFGTEPERTGPKVHGLVLGTVMSRQEFEATFVHGKPSEIPVAFEIVNEDGSVSPLPDGYEESRRYK